MIMGEDGSEEFGVRLDVRKALLGEAEFVVTSNRVVIGIAEEEVGIVSEDAIFEFGWGEAGGQGWDGSKSGRRRRGEDRQWSANRFGQHGDDHRCGSTHAGCLRGSKRRRLRATRFG